MTWRELLDNPLGRAHRRIHNVWLHDLAGRFRQRRRTQAIHDGDNPNAVENYPMSGDVNIVHQNPGIISTLVTSAALVAGGR